MSASSEDRISKLRNLLDQDPHDAFCMYGIAMEHAKNGRFDEAVAWFDQTIETDSTYCYAWLHKAKCQHDNDDSKSASSTLEEGIKQAREQGDLHAAEEMSSYLNSIR
ncbi:MAG: hypothetical protein QF718_03250 [Phycisphaerales bacterium]|jgi:tetratricopeptide (TPR) repeat protein|nr:hypothetical protein [Phycisphaerales bacterium]